MNYIKTIGLAGDGASFKSDLKVIVPVLLIIIIIAIIQNRRSKK